MDLIRMIAIFHVWPLGQVISSGKSTCTPS